jgi:hypothetical protein
MFARLVIFVASSAIATALFQPVYAQGPITYVEDFEGESQGPQSYPGGYSFYGGGIPPTWAYDSAPPIVTEGVVAGGVGGLQAFEITADSTASSNPADPTQPGYFNYGLGGFHGFFGENFGAAQGQPGEDDPANYVMTFDLKSVGHLAASPVRGQVTLYKSDYETVFGVDLNVDGDTMDGFDIWRSEFTVAPAADNYANFNQVIWKLNEGTTPVVPGDGNPVPAPFFDDESYFTFQLFFDQNEFGHDAGNAITIDNVALTFTPVVVGPGDFDLDGDVDGNDFLKWQRGESSNFLSDFDLADWKAAFGAGGAIAAARAIPEPSSIAGAVVAGVGLLYGRRRGARRPLSRAA